MRTSTLHAAVIAGAAAASITAAAMANTRHRANAAAADQIAAARRAGYRTGLMHAALGLLNTPPDRPEQDQ